MNELNRKKKQHTELKIQIHTLTDMEEKNEGEIRLLRTQKELGALANLFPKDPHFLLKWSLGSAQFSLPEATKLRYKTEYESFKLKMTVANCIFSVMNLFFLQAIWSDILHNFLLLYFYSTITLREHILQVNGSRIRTWWRKLCRISDQMA